MPSNVKHQFVSGKSDDPDDSLVNPSNWNDEHTGAIEILDRDLAQVDVLNTTDEISIYSHTIPAGQLGTTGGIRLTIVGDYVQNSGGNTTLLLKVKLGATTVITSSPLSIGEHANRRKWQLDIWFLNSAADAQKWGGKFILSATITTEDLSLLGSGDYQGAAYATSAEDTTGALVLDVTAQHGSATNTSFRKEMAMLEEIPAA